MPRSPPRTPDYQELCRELMSFWPVFANEVESCRRQFQRGLVRRPGQTLGELYFYFTAIAHILYYYQDYDSEFIDIPEVDEVITAYRLLFQAYHDLSGQDQCYSFHFNGADQSKLEVK